MSSAAAIFLLIAAIGFVPAQAQLPPATSASAPAAACTLSGQLPEAAFDPNLVEFVAHPQPLISPFNKEDTGLSFKVIARVVGVSPPVFEILDQEKLRDTLDPLPPCQMQRIYSVDARLRNVLPGLRFGDLVQARLMAAQGGIVPLILSEVEKIPGEPKYLHEPSAEGSCSSRAGALITYRKVNGETLMVRHDGSIYYTDVLGNVFSRHRIGEEDLARLMQAMRAADFNAFASSLPPLDNTPMRPAITLICARHQRVLIPGREPILAPVMAALEEVKKKVLADSYYALKYDEKREITILDWPLRELPLAQAEALKSAARKRAYDLKQVGQSAPGDAEVVYQPLPAGLLAKLPDSAMTRPFALDAKGIPVAYPNRDVYVRDGQKIYRVEKLSCADPAAKCGSFDNLSVQELRVPEARPVAATSTDARGDERPHSQLPGGFPAILWPADAGIRLDMVPAQGQRITDGEVARVWLYRELDAAAPWGQAFVEGRYCYDRLRMLRMEGGTQ